MTLWFSRLVDALEVVDLERPPDAVPGEVLQKRQHDELMLPGLPGIARREEPARLTVLEAYLALHGEARARTPTARSSKP